MRESDCNPCPAPMFTKEKRGPPIPKNCGIVPTSRVRARNLSVRVNRSHTCTGAVQRSTSRADKGPVRVNFAAAWPREGLPHVVHAVAESEVGLKRLRGHGCRIRSRLDSGAGYRVARP